MNRLCLMIGVCLLSSLYVDARQIRNITDIPDERKLSESFLEDYFRTKVRHEPPAQVKRIAVIAFQNTVTLPQGSGWAVGGLIGATVEGAAEERIRKEQQKEYDLSAHMDSALDACYDIFHEEFGRRGGDVELVRLALDSTPSPRSIQRSSRTGGSERPTGYKPAKGFAELVRVDRSEQALQTFNTIMAAYDLDAVVVFDSKLIFATQFFRYGKLRMTVYGRGFTTLLRSTVDALQEVDVEDPRGLPGRLRALRYMRLKVPHIPRVYREIAKCYTAILYSYFGK